MSKADGRMINKKISRSKGFASLSPEAAVLFTMLIPHYNTWGKMNGDPGYIKGEICPRVPYLTYENVSELLQEITEKTSVKWFQHDGLYYLHSLHFLNEHQNLRRERMGEDSLPSWPEYSGSTPGVSPESDGSTPAQEEVEGKKKLKPDVSSSKKQPGADSSKKILEETEGHDTALSELKEIEKQFIQHFGVDKRWPFQFLSKMKKQHNGALHPPEVSIRIFREAMNGKKVDDLWALCTHLYEIHSQNVSEERHLRGHQKKKGDVVDLGSILGKGKD